MGWTKRRVIAAICVVVSGILLLSGGILLFSNSGRDAASYSIRRFHLKSRSEEDALIPAPKDLNLHAQFLERSKQGNIGLVFLGDSITHRWPILGEASWRKLAHYKPANFGVDGDCTEHLLWRIEHGELDAVGAKVVVILIGTNNVLYFPDEKPEWTAKGVKKIVQTVRKRSPGSKVLLLGIFPRDEKESRTRLTIASINQEIEALDDGSRVHFLDIGNQFLDGDGNIPSEIMPDKVHLSAHGYDLWYKAMELVLPELMR